MNRHKSNKAKSNMSAYSILVCSPNESRDIADRCRGMLLLLCHRMALLLNPNNTDRCAGWCQPFYIGCMTVKGVWNVCWSTVTYDLDQVSQDVIDSSTSVPVSACSFHFTKWVLDGTRHDKSHDKINLKNLPQWWNFTIGLIFLKASFPPWRAVQCSFSLSIYFFFEAESWLCNHNGIKEAHFELHIKNLWV